MTAHTRFNPLLIGAKVRTVHVEATYVGKPVAFQSPSNRGQGAHIRYTYSEPLRSQSFQSPSNRGQGAHRDLTPLWREGGNLCFNPLLIGAKVRTQSTSVHPMIV